MRRHASWFLFGPAYGDQIGEETSKVPGIFILGPHSTDRHHERDCRVNLLVRPRLGGIQVAASVSLASPETPLSLEVAITTQIEPSAGTASLDNL